MELLNRSLRELHTLIKRKELKPSELVEAVLKRIEETEGKLNAYITVTDEKARRKAKIADEELTKLSEDEVPELFGIPLSIKDNINVENVRMTCASKILENFVSPYDATVTKRLRERGAIFVGKNNSD